MALVVSCGPPLDAAPPRFPRLLCWLVGGRTSCVLVEEHAKGPAMVSNTSSCADWRKRPCALGRGSERVNVGRVIDNRLLILRAERLLGTALVVVVVVVVVGATVGVGDVVAHGT